MKLAASMCRWNPLWPDRAWPLRSLRRTAGRGRWEKRNGMKCLAAQEWAECCQAQWTAPRKDGVSIGKGDHAAKPDHPPRAFSAISAESPRAGLSLVRA